MKHYILYQNRPRLRGSLQWTGNREQRTENTGSGKGYNV